MTALWILLGLIALIWLLLATPLRIFLSYYDGKLHFRLKYGLLSLLDSDKPPKKKAPKKTAKPTTKKPKKKSSGSMQKLLDFLGLSEIGSIANIKKTIRSYGVVRLIRNVHAALRRIFARIFGLVKKGVFQQFDLRITVGDSDAADAALQYGEICAVTYPLLTFLKNHIKFKNPNLEIRCNYALEYTEIFFKGQLNYRPWHFVCFGASLVADYLKSKRKKE